MMFQIDDPFHYILEQKIHTSNNNHKTISNIKLNLNKLPKDFFPQPIPRKTNSLSQRISSNRVNHVNQFLAYNKTVQLRRDRKPSSFVRGNSKILQNMQKRQLTATDKKRPEKRRFTEGVEEEIKIFNGTFARKMYRESSEERKRHLPALDTARRLAKLNVEQVQ